ncbi:MAG: hypothetical protein K1X39_00415 [Thermoflexales bacterium]|nr:hypothetical protein [Thermoflexales bacterium]
MGSFSRLVGRRRTAYSVLLGILALMVPCYVLGFALLALVTPVGGGPGPVPTMTFLPPTAPPTAPTPTLGAVLPTVFALPTLTIAPTATRTLTPPPSATATQTATASATPSQTATASSTPTRTPTPTPTQTATPLAPTSTPLPTKPPPP